MLLRGAESTEPIPVTPAADGFFFIKPRDYRPAQIFSPLFVPFVVTPLGQPFFWAKNRQKATQKTRQRHPIVKRGLSNSFFCQKRLLPSGNIATTMTWVNPKSPVRHLQQHCHRHSHLHPRKLFATGASRFQS
jgi:hypothetical protein